MMKKVLVFLLIVSISLFSFVPVAYGDESINHESIAHTEQSDMNQKKRLSEMTDNELKAFLLEYVNGYKADETNQESMFRFLKDNLAQFDSAGETPIPYGYTLYWTWTKQIDEGIKAYYNGEPQSQNTGFRDNPIQNEFYQVPSYMYTCNCYGYAIGIHVLANPGFSDDEITLDINRFEQRGRSTSAYQRSP